MYVREAFRYQNPSLVVLDSTVYNKLKYDSLEPSYRTGVDHLRFSLDKMRFALEMVRNDSRQSLISYVFPAFRYHDRWNTLSKKDFMLFSRTHYSDKGFSSSGEISSLDDPVAYEMFSEEIDPDLDLEAVESLKRIQQLCEKRGARLLMIQMPNLRSHSYSRHNGTEALFDELGIDYIDFNMEDNWNAVGLDKKADFATTVHLNIQGSDKLMTYLGNYLKENYELPDHREDPAYRSWEEDVSVMREKAFAWLEASGDTSKKCLVRGTRNEDGTATISLPALSYADYVNLSVRQGTGGEKKLLAENYTDTEYLVVEPGDNDTYFAEFHIAKLETPYTVAFKVK